MTVMLRLFDHFGATDKNTGQTWYQFCKARGYTLREMFGGSSWKGVIEQRNQERAARATSIPTVKRSSRRNVL